MDQRPYDIVQEPAPRSPGLGPMALGLIIGFWTALSVCLWIYYAGKDDGPSKAERLEDAHQYAAGLERLYGMPD